MNFRDTLDSYKNSINSLKYEIINDFNSNSEESMNYNILYVNLMSDASGLKVMMDIPPLETITVLGKDTMNQDMEMCLVKFMITLSAFYEVLLYKNIQDQTLLKALMENLNTRMSQNSSNILADIGARGLIMASIDITKQSISTTNSKRIKAKNTLKTHMKYLFKCVYHTWKTGSDMESLKNYNMYEFLDFCSKYNVLEKSLIEDMYEMLTSMDDVSILMYTNLYSSMITYKSLKVDIDHLLSTIFKAFNEYKKDPEEYTSMLNVVSLLSCLDVVSQDIELDLSQYDDDSVMSLVFITMEILKYFYKHKDKVFNVFIDIENTSFSVLLKILKKEPGILDSFLLREIPYTILTSAIIPDKSNKNLVSIFKILSKETKFFQYVASFDTQSILDTLSEILKDEKKYVDKLMLKHSLYETIGTMDTDNLYRDEITGCIIVIPAILMCGEREIWVDKYAFLGYLYQKPENPYTRESLTPEDFRRMQKENKDKIRDYRKERKEFIMSIIDDE